MCKESTQAWREHFRVSREVPSVALLAESSIVAVLCAVCVCVIVL